MEYTYNSLWVLFLGVRTSITPEKFEPSKKYLFLTWGTSFIYLKRGVISSREGGDIGLFITQSLKFYNSVLLNFDRLIHKSEYPNVSATNYILQKL